MLRIIAATNHDLSNLVQEKKFREDLYYRVNVVGIKLPPLRDRMEDIPILVDHFIARFNRLQKKDVTGISNEALSCLMSYTFPGNIRELENIIERAFVICCSGMIKLHHLPESLRSIPYIDYPNQQDNMTFKQMEKSFLLTALRNNNWNRAQTARQLGIHKTTLYRKIKSLGIELSPYNSSS